MQHGFNKQTVRLFITDHLQGLMLGIVIGGALLGPILHLIEWGGEHFYLYVFGFVVGTLVRLFRTLRSRPPARSVPSDYDAAVPDAHPAALQQG